MAKKKKKKVSKKKNVNKKNRNSKNKKKSTVKKSASAKKVVDAKKTKSASTEKGKSVVKKEDSKESKKKKSTVNHANKESVVKNKTIKNNKKNDVKNVKENKEVVTSENKVVKENKEVVASENKVVKKEKINKAKIRKIFIIFVMIICIGLIILFIKLMNDKKKGSVIEFEKLEFNEYLELYNSEELQFIYLTDDSCMDCSNYEVYINNLQVEYKLNIKKFDFSDLNEKDLEKFKASHSYLADDIDVPMIISIKDGEEINQVSGIKEYSVLKKFVDYSLNPSDSNSFEKISLDKYLTLLESKETTLIYIGDSNNKGCKKFTPILEKVSSNKKIKVNYLNTVNMSKESDWDKLNNSNKIFKKQWFMPVVLVVKNGKVKDYRMETMDEKTLEKFLSKNGL